MVTIMHQIKQKISQLATELKAGQVKRQSLQDEASVNRKQITELSNQIGLINNEVSKEKEYNSKIREGKRDRTLSEYLSTSANEIGQLEKQRMELNSSLEQLRRDISLVDASIYAKSIKLSNLKAVIAADESVMIMRNALDAAGLLKPIQQVAALNKSIHPEIGTHRLKESILHALFNAVFLDEKLPTFEASLKAMENRIN
jgi:chromosome segregation ATPase